MFLKFLTYIASREGMATAFGLAIIVFIFFLISVFGGN